MRLEKVWIEQCRATPAIKRRFGVKNALDYLVGEKLRAFAGAARHLPLAPEVGVWALAGTILGTVASGS